MNSRNYCHCPSLTPAWCIYQRMKSMSMWIYRFVSLVFVVRTQKPSQIVLLDNCLHLSANSPISLSTANVHIPASTGSQISLILAFSIDSIADSCFLLQNFTTNFTRSSLYEFVNSVSTWNRFLPSKPTDITIFLSPNKQLGNGS